MTSGADWGEQARRLVEGLRGGMDDASPDGGGTCRWCPHCQLTAALRGDRPELTAALADVLAATASALRTFADAPPPSGPEGGEAAPSDVAASAAPTEGPQSPFPAVQRIDIA